MSFSPGSWVFVKLSRLFFEFHIWVMLRMYLNGKVSTSLCKLPPGVRLKKVNETEIGPDYATRFSRQFLFLWLVALVVTACIWYSFNLGCVVTTRNEKNSEYCEEQRFNVSKNQLHAFASLFSNSDQMISLECVRVPGPEKQLSNSIACSLKSLCSEKQKIEHEHHWLADTTELRNQCSVRDEIDWKHSTSFLHEDSLSVVSQPPDLSTSSENQNCGQNSLQTMREVSTKHQCGNSPYSLLKGGWWFLVIVILSWKVSGGHLNLLRCRKHDPDQLPPSANQSQLLLPQKQQQEFQKSPKIAGKWRKKLLIIFVLLGVLISIWLFWHLNEKIKLRRKETLASMCDERARMLQDQFNVSMNHVHALAILVSTFHHGKYPSAIDQVTFGKYTERTAFERPLTSGVAYALKVVHSEREEFENRQGWTIKQMGTEDQTLVQDCMPENLSPAPVQDEYAPVIFSQETVSHIVSIDMMSGKEDRENILRARTTGKGVLTSPFKLLKSNHLGVVLTFAVYNVDLPPDATPEQRTEATVGYLGASYDIRSLVDKLLHQLASKQTIVVHVYDTTNASTPIVMYGDEVQDTGLLNVSSLDFGDPSRKHEMHCRFKQKPPVPWTAINASVGVLVIFLLVGYIFHAAISQIAKVENDYHKMMELKARAEAADVAKSQFLAAVSHEIRTPMNGVLGMLQMLMDTNLDANQMDFAQTAHASGKDLISLINEVLDQAKIESGRLELELVPFDIRSILDNILSLFSGKSNEKGIELAVYVSDQVPEVLVGDPGRVRQIITNLVGNSIKFTDDKGHIFVSVHLVGEAKGTPVDKILQQGSGLMQDMSSRTYNTLSGYPVVERSKSWEKFKLFNSANASEDLEKINLLVTVEDTGVGIPLDAQSRIFTPFMQADSSTSRTYGGTGIGLSISKHLVELMHGEIGFVSKPNVGSTFSFTGTFVKGEKMPLDPKWQHYDSLVSVFRGFKALVIDSKTIRTEVTRYHLQRLGISVQTTSTLNSACDLLSTTSASSDVACADVVLIDKEVWNKEVFILFRDLLKRSRQNGETKIFVKFPKVFLLGSSISTTECNYLKSAGMIDNVITKPLRLSVLIACFKEALGGDRSRLLNIKKTSTLGTLLREKQILVVDDNMVNRRVAEGALKKYGAIVTCVNSGKDALKMLKLPHKFDACFMDIQMPEMHGFDATRLIRSAEAEVNQKIASGEASAEMYGGISHWHIPILAMTADVIQATNEECAKCGMDDYVTKPFEEAQLYNAVARFFESSG